MAMTTPALGNNVVMQVGIIVRDIESKARAWSEILGLPEPDIIITDSVEKTRAEYKGRPLAGRARLAFFQMGQVTVELIEPVDGPSTWKDQLDEHGDSLHHIAFDIEGMKEKTDYLNSQGVPLIQKGEYEGGRYAYFDGVTRLGTIIELLENDD